MVARSSSAYTGLQPNSPLLTNTQRWTEDLVASEGLESLRASILWARPDNVVETEPYSTDWDDDSLEGTSHQSVCKPMRDWRDEPWSFVESGHK